MLKPSEIINREEQLNKDAESHYVDWWTLTNDKNIKKQKIKMNYDASSEEKIGDRVYACCITFINKTKTCTHSESCQEIELIEW